MRRLAFKGGTALKKCYFADYRFSEDLDFTLTEETAFEVDVTVREILVYPLIARPVLRAYEEYSDLPEEADLQVYSLSEIGGEKAVAIRDRARTEPRDIHDLAFSSTEAT